MIGTKQIINSIFLMMKHFLLFICLCLITGVSFSQNDNCTLAPTLTIGAICSSPIAGSSFGATQSISGCTGNADDDVWYKFVAISTSHSIQVTPSSGYDAVVEVFSGNCSTFTSLNCIDMGLTGATENALINGLTIGTTYYLRIYHYFAGSGSGTFTTCISNPPPAPSNDNCSGATALTVNASCISSTGTSYGATQSQAPCIGSSDDDVWFSFVANNYTQTIQVTSSANMDAVVQLFSGSCGSLTSLYCQDNTLTNGIETINAIGLNPGTTYYVRVYDYLVGGGYNFNICVSGTPIGAGQPNDNPCTALQLPTVTSDCNYLQFSTIGATATSSLLAPLPASCAGGSSPFMGGYSAATKDVWFKITVPANGNIFITPQPNLGVGFITDGVMALYSGSSCSALTQIACSDDYSSYPLTANDLLPYISATGLTPGSTVYLRYWAFASSQGSFGLCVQSPTNDNCSNALFICDLNGYSGSTSSAYSADRPCNMFGNNETNAGVDQPDGINTGGVFGQGGSWGTGSPSVDVIINNNSWIKFTAAAANASFKIIVGNCWVGNYPSGGLQMQIFSAGSACCSFTPVSDFKEGSSTFTINATGLTVGNSYYLMVDGYAGDICNYSISALTGVSFANIAATSNSICPGGNVILTGPSAASSYTWLPSGSTSNTISVNPGSTITYSLIAGGVCGFKQTLTKQILVNPLPTVFINSGSNISTCGTQTTNLTGSGASTYTWNTGTIASSIIVSPSVTTSYTLTGSATTGCSNTAVSTITVFTLPQLTTTPTILPSNCSASTGSINNITVIGVPSITYSWTNGSSALVGTSPNLNTQPAGTYNLLVKDGNGCFNNFGPYSIINPGAPPAPTASTSASQLCVGNSINLFSSSTTLGSTFNWSGPNSFSSVIQNPSIPGATNLMSGVYSVYATAAGCSGPAASVTVTINNNPTPSITSSQPNYCVGDVILLFSSSASSYNWSGPNGFSSSVQNPTISPASTFESGLYQVVVTSSASCSGTTNVSITVNSNPVLSAFASNTAVCAGDALVLNSLGGNSYAWLGPNGFNSSIQNPTITPTSILYAGSYSVITTNTLTGCSSDTTVLVAINPLPNFTVASNSASVCTNSTIQLTANGNNITSYNWNGPLSYSATGANQTITNASVNNTGNYSVTVINVNSCQSSSIVTVFVYPLTVVNANAGLISNTFCTGNSIYLFGTTNALNYNWAGPNSFISSAQNPTITNAQSIVAGIYTLTIFDQNNCTNSDTVNISINTTPSLVSSNGGITCLGENIVLNANYGNNVVVNWFQDIALTTSLALNSNTFSPTFSAFGTFTFYAQGVLNDCASSVSSVVANYYSVLAGISSPTISGLAPLTVQFTNTSIGITTSNSINWNFGDGNISNAYDPSNVFLEPGTYTTVLTVSNGFCTDTTQIVIDVYVAEVIVPELLTPNGDGKNDVFNIKNIDYFPNNELLIFNRWGNLVYKMKGYKNTWDGTPNSEGKTGSDKLPTSTYFYLLQLNDKDAKVYRGFVELIY